MARLRMLKKMESRARFMASPLSARNTPNWILLSFELPRVRNPVIGEDHEGTVDGTVLQDVRVVRPEGLYDIDVEILFVDHAFPIEGARLPEVLGVGEERHALETGHVACRACRVYRGRWTSDTPPNADASLQLLLVHFVRNSEFLLFANVLIPPGRLPSPQGSPSLMTITFPFTHWEGLP